MYSTKIKDTTTITWHNLHFLLEYYCQDTLSTIEKIIVDQEYDDDRQSLQDFKKEIISTIKTIKGIKTVVNHHRTMMRSA